MWQFAAGKNSKFVPFSKYPPVNKDIAFWVPEEFHENGFYEVVCIYTMYNIYMIEIGSYEAVC